MTESEANNCAYEAADYLPTVGWEDGVYIVYIKEDYCTQEFRTVEEFMAWWEE